jgi:hypothetical protein
MPSECLRVLEKRWLDTCHVLFKEEAGPLSDYATYLLHFTEPIAHRKSSVSGHEVSYAIREYAEGSKWIGLEEVDFNKKFQPLSINDIKDMDSLLAAVSERAHYAGNIVLGNCGQVEKSSNISDSFFMHETGILADCKYIGYCTLGRLCEDNFGGNGIGESTHCIKCYETYRDKRCFELWMGQNSSDCYYSHNIDSCQDAMFCFNVKNKRRAIGNLELEAGKYAQIKAKLLSEMAGMLRRDKKLPSLVEIAGECAMQKPAISMKSASVEAPGEKTDKSAIENAFARAYSLLLGSKPAGSIDAYSTWLRRHVNRNEEHPSAFSGKKVLRYDYSCYFEIPPHRLLKKEEALSLGEQAKISAADAASLTLANAHEKIGKIAFFTSEYMEGTHANLIDVATSSSSSNCYRASPVVYSKYCGYCFWPRSTEHAFGSAALLDSEFCINCYHSVKLRRCLEMDSCRSCSDSMFCHNCENLEGCMFCFNTKNKRYAIGNVEVGKENYMKAKAVLLSWLAGELARKKDLHIDIYNMGRVRPVVPNIF